MKRALTIVVLAASLACQNDDNNDPVIGCSQTCFDCTGMDSPRTYPGSFPPVDCSPKILDMSKDRICYHNTDDPENVGAPWCFYNCNKIEECVPPVQ